jgi:sialidase-1
VVAITSGTAQFHRPGADKEGVTPAIVSRFLALSLAATGLFLSPPSAAGATSAAASTAYTAASVHCSASPFRSSPAQHRWFRIPALVQTSAGTLVAFAERRDNNDTTDTGDFDVVTTRSTDHGCTWSAYRVIGNDAANRVSSPAPILDATTGKILLFSVDTQRTGSGGVGKGLYLQTSSDDGRTFSPLLSHPVRPTGNYKGGLIGPGHGIQLTVTHPGRLILPLGYRTSSGNYGAYGIYSDDHGVSWKTGFSQQDTTGNVKFLEGTIAELPTGDLFISFRNKRDGATAGTARADAISKDGGASLNSAFATSTLKIVSVEGSALALKGPHSDELLFSAPANTTANLRRDMTIFVSRTGGTSWGKKYQVTLEDTPGAYSDLVQVDGGWIGVLYETGIATWKERIAYESISIAALTNPVLVASRLAYARSANPTRTSGRAKVMVTVTVSGIHSPPGRITLKYVRGSRIGRASVDLTYSNRGVRAIVLPRLAAGSYQLTLTYSGTGRIKSLTKSAGTLRVVSG